MPALVVLVPILLYVKLQCGKLSLEGVNFFYGIQKVNCLYNPIVFFFHLNPNFIILVPTLT